MIDAEGRLFGRINLLDLGLVVLLSLAILGFGLAKAGRAGLNAKIKGKTAVEVDCFIRGSIADPDSLFRKGDKTFITLRNVPYSAVEVVAIRSSKRTITVPTADGKAVVAVPDPSEPFSRDILVTIREQGAVTDDGVVFGDSKIKVGTPIELEGFKYRLKGSIVDVRTPDLK
ncbi:MAG: DUF4330 domain-containing protein [Candidatus Sericytochromatia bacterium]|nr:DUF4330 domain-containing protein [Candidatus Tanganyikabacteria bacterium]